MSLKWVSDFFSILDGAGREAMGKALDHEAFESGGKAHDTFERGGGSMRPLRVGGGPMRPLRVGEAHATFESWGGPMGPLRVEGGPMCGGIKQVNIYPHVGGYLVTILLPAS